MAYNFREVISFIIDNKLDLGKLRETELNSMLAKPPNADNFMKLVECIVINAEHFPASMRNEIVPRATQLYNELSTAPEELRTLFLESGIIEALFTSPRENAETIREIKAVTTEIEPIVKGVETNRVNPKDALSLAEDSINMVKRSTLLGERFHGTLDRILRRGPRDPNTPDGTSRGKK